MEHNITEQIAHLVLQIGVILIAAKLLGNACERWLRQPAVLGELCAGMIIGPYALGVIEIPHVGALFPLPHGGEEALIPVSVELFAVAQIGAVVLLFAAGLETDLRMFLRYALPASLVAAGGVVAPLVLGAGITVWWGLAESWLTPSALFMGTILVATSVGITARVLSDIKKLDTPEGVTILGGAVVDDVLGIIVLTVVVALTRSADGVSPGQIALIFLKAAGFWVGLMVIGIVSGKRFTKILRGFRSEGSIVALGLAVCFIVAAVAELGAGLAMIIGAYTVGLALSPTDLAHYLEERITPIYHFLVPVFFVVMGMMVDFRATGGLLGFAVLACVVAFLTKVLGCGLPSLLVGFNLRGAWRIGLGMLPRGEVALIVAGVGIASGAIGKDIYGVAVLVTVVTTLAAPILLVPAFRGPSGRNDARETAGERAPEKG